VSHSHGRTPAGDTSLQSQPSNQGSRLLSQSTHRDPQTLEPRTPCVLPADNHQAVLAGLGYGLCLWEPGLLWLFDLMSGRPAGLSWMAMPVRAAWPP
jgi:hypothetical protein